MSQHKTWWLSPGKLNLFLHINQRYANGYHHLQTLFQFVDVADQLQFELTDHGQITMAQGLDNVADEDNLILRAARLLQQTTGTEQGCMVRCRKTLPMGGGMGGGSSNAATTLLVLNKLWQTDLSNQRLQQLGLQLGADVPVFIHGQTCFAEGVGEHFYPAQHAGETYLIIHPQIHVSTADIFTHPDLIRNTPALAWSEYTFAETHNDCQPIVEKLHANIAILLQHLLEYAPSRMTGTGACVFAVFASKNAAEKALTELKDNNIIPPSYWTCITEGLQQSPLHAQLHALL